MLLLRGRKKCMFEVAAQSKCNTRQLFLIFTRYRSRVIVILLILSFSKYAILFFFTLRSSNLCITQTMSSRINLERMQRVQEMAQATEKHAVETAKQQTVQNATPTIWNTIQQRVRARLAKVRSPDNFAREGVKLAIVLAAPVVFTFILTQPQFGEHIILKYVRGHKFYIILDSIY